MTRDERPVRVAECRRRASVRPLRAGSLLVALVVLIASGCSSLRQAIGNRPCELDPENPYDVVHVDLVRHEVRLYWKRPDGTLFSTLNAVKAWVREQGDSLVAATNAGIFEPGFVPSGLYVDGGEVRHPLNLHDGEGNFYLKPNGVFLILGNEQDGEGAGQTARVVDAERFAEVHGKVEYATQSGPLLLMDGTIHPAFSDGSENCRVRSGVGVDEEGRLYLVISNGAVSFYDFASYFRDALGVRDALYLDGGISELHAPALGRVQRGGEEFAVILAVLERQ